MIPVFVCWLTECALGLLTGIEVRISGLHRHDDYYRIPMSAALSFWLSCSSVCRLLVVQGLSHLSSIHHRPLISAKMIMSPASQGSKMPCPSEMQRRGNILLSREMSPSMMNRPQMTASYHQSLRAIARRESYGAPPISQKFRFKVG